MKVGMMDPTPGISPRKNPIPVPRAMAPSERRHSSRLGKRPVSLVLSTWRAGASAVMRISPMPNRPMTTGMKPTPS